MSKKGYVPISIALLYEGMTAPQDIYDYSLQTLLVPQGGVVGAALIAQLGTVYKDRPTLSVSPETARVMQRQGIEDSAIKSRADLEKRTGYLEAVRGTAALLEAISKKRITVLSQKDLLSVSRELSRVFDGSEPEALLELVNAAAPPDEYLRRHCVNVALLNGLIGRWLGLQKEIVDLLLLVGLLHDCGKALLPARILNSSRPMTGIEFEVIKTHPMLSGTLLSEFPETLRKSVRGHHERINGKGYPDGLSGVGIPFLSRVTAVSDVYDAMTARRFFKDPKSPFAVLGALSAMKGAELDKAVSDAFLAKLPERLTGKPVLMSNGSVGVVHFVDPGDVKHPTIKLGGRLYTADDELYCLSMFFEEDSTLGNSGPAAESTAPAAPKTSQSG